MADSVGIVVTWDPKDVSAVLARFDAKQWAYATAVALTRTAQKVKEEEIEGMRSAFDRPRPYTLNSLRIEAARKDNLTAFVGLKTGGPANRSAEKYLSAEVHGGQRRHVGFEGRMRRDGWLPAGRWLVPADGAPRDSYGSVRRGFYPTVLRQLNEQKARTGTRAAKGTAKRGNRYFYGAPGGTRGVWMRRGRSIRPMFLETGPPSYHPSFKFFDIAERTAKRVFLANFDAAVADAIKTAR